MLSYADKPSKIGESKYWIYYVIFFDLSGIFDYIAHSIFAMKFWVISKQLNFILSNKVDKNFEIKANVLLYG